MRSLSDSLKAAMQSLSIDFLVKIQLTHGVSSYIYDQTRILEISPEEEQPYSHTARVVLDNSDGALTNLDLKGYKAVISWGAVTTSGNEYSDTPPLWVIGQQLNSSPSVLDCTLELWGIPNFLAEDRASEDYLPDEDDTRTVKYLLNAIIGSWSTIPAFDWCPVYGVIFDSEDDLIDTYMPKDSFRIYVNDSRLAKIRELLDYTRCVMRFGGDGNVHIFNPTTSGEVYDYQYSLESGHTFFAKAYRKRLVIPNAIYVTSQPDDIPKYAGTAGDDESINAFREVREFKRIRLQSDLQAQGIAQATLSKYQLNAEMGAAEVPINFGAELFDYNKVTDERESDYRVGNIGSLTRNYKAYGEQYSMRFSLGGWLTVRKLLNDLQVLGGFDFNRLTVKDLYAESLLAENIDLIWLDPEGNVDLSLIGDDLDGLPDGEYYARVKSIHIDAGQIKLDEHIFYQAGYDPTTKEQEIKKQSWAPSFPAVNDLWLDTSVTPNQLKRWTGWEWIKCDPANLDDLGDGITYKRILSAALTAGGLVLLDQVVVGTYGLVKSTDISAGHILLSSVEQDIEPWAAGIEDALAAAADAQETADGKILSFYQTTAPYSGMSLGDLWFDTNDNNKVYRYNGSSWVSVKDLEIAEAIDAAAGAQATADGKVVTFYQSSTPTAEGVGDLWVDTGDNNNLYRWTGSSWVRFTHVGEWYDESGVEIDANHGINIYGTDMAFTTRATKTGTIQCYVGSDGKIYAGGGAVSLDASGITITGQNIRWKYGGVVQGSIAATNQVLLISAVYDLFLSAGTGRDVVLTSTLRPNTSYSEDIGELGTPFNNVYGKIFRPPTTGGFILRTSAIAEAGSIKWDGDGGIYVHDGSDWRHIT